MTRSTHAIVLLAIGSMLLLGIQFARTSAATTRQDAVRRQLDHVRNDVRELARLSSRSVTRLYGAPPDADVQAAVVDVLVQIGLPADTARSIRRDSDRALTIDTAHSRIRIRDMRVELHAVSPHILGEFLSLWRVQQPAWIVRSISLRKSTSRGSKPSEYDVSLTCTARYTDTRPTP